MNAGIQYKILKPGDDSLLTRVAPDVFDHPIDPQLAGEFLRDPRHHIAVAIDQDVVVGFASAIHYIHPDKPAELWVNEVGVAPTHQRQGIGKAILRLLFAHGRLLGCKSAWVLTERANEPAIGLYRACGGEEPEDETVMFSFELGEIK